MINFGDKFKQKVEESERRQEVNITSDFKKVYGTLLENYNISAIEDLNDQSKLAFLTELNKYWSKDSGISELGKKFIKRNEMFLTENSTPLQKKNFLKQKVENTINELFRQSDVKYKIYSILDEMYNQVGGVNISDVMSPEYISNTVTESLAKSLDGFVKNMYSELKASSINESNDPEEILNNLDPNMPDEVFVDELKRIYPDGYITGEDFYPGQYGYKGEKFKKIKNINNKLNSVIEKGLLPEPGPEFIIDYR